MWGALWTLVLTHQKFGCVGWVERSETQQTPKDVGFIELNFVDSYRTVVNKLRV